MFFGHTYSLVFFLGIIVTHLVSRLVKGLTWAVWNLLGGGLARSRLFCFSLVCSLVLFLLFAIIGLSGKISCRNSSAHISGQCVLRMSLIDRRYLWISPLGIAVLVHSGWYDFLWMYNCLFVGFMCVLTSRRPVSANWGPL